MSSSLWAMGWRPSVADWGGGMSASCKPRVQLFAWCAAVSLAHATQLPFPRL